MMMVMVMAGVDHNDNLRLRRIGCCEAEDEHESKQNLFHNSVCRSGIRNTELL